MGINYFSIHDYRTDTNSIASYFGEPVTALAEVEEVKNSTDSRDQLILKNIELIGNKSVVHASGKIQLIVFNPNRALICGDKIVFSTVLESISNRNNPGEFDAQSFFINRKIVGSGFIDATAMKYIGHRNSVSSFLTSWRNFLISSMEKELDGDFLGIAKALLLGDKSSLENDVVNSFTATGAMHVLAVSGLHIGMLLQLIVLVLSVFGKWLKKRQQLLIALVLIWVYGGLTGASPAVMRAVVMFSILAIGSVIERKNSPLNLLALSAIVLLFFDPWSLFDIGFQLSYAAMLGIFLVYKPILNVYSPTKKWMQLIWEGTAVGIAATIFTTPLTLFWFYQFPNYFLLANVGVMAFGTAVLMLGIVFMLTSLIPIVVKISALLFSFSVVGLILWVNWVASLPGAISGGFQLSIFTVTILYLLIGCWVFFLYTFESNRSKQLSKWALVVGTITVVSAIGYQRFEVIESNKLVIFNSNQFTIALKIGNTTYGIYDQKYSGSWKQPRELVDYSRFTGTKLIVIRIKNDNLELKKNTTFFKIEKNKELISICLNNKKWFYRYSGIPNNKTDNRLMTTRLQLYQYPNRETQPFMWDF